MHEMSNNLSTVHILIIYFNTSFRAHAASAVMTVSVTIWIQL